MYRIFISAIIILAFLSAPAVATDNNWPFIKNAPTFSTLQTLVTATTGTGSATRATAIDLGMPFNTITCLVTNPTGSVPTDAETILYGGIDGTNLVTLATHTSTTFPDIFTTRTITAIPVNHIQGEYSGRNGGGPSTVIKLECMASH